MHSSIIALGAVAFAGFSVAQNTVQQNYPYTINPDSVSQSDRQYWCDQNQAQCPLICLQQAGVTSMSTEQNDCDPDLLTYTCICDNGVSPNITQYSQTLPFFICQAWGNQCVAACQGDNTCQSNCRQNHPCGAQSPFKGNASLSSTASTASATASATTRAPVTGFGGATTTATSSTSQAGAKMASLLPGAGMGMATVFGGIFLGFAVLM